MVHCTKIFVKLMSIITTQSALCNDVAKHLQGSWNVKVTITEANINAIDK